MQSYRGLALETSGRAGSVAVFEGTTLVATHTLDPAQRSAQSLAPALARLLAQVEWQPTDIKLVAVAQGPGSFTGLRVGVTTAKVFAYAIQANVIGVDTLEAIAAAVPQHVSKLQVVMDAQRGDLYTATFARPSPLESLAPLTSSRILSMENWLASLDSDTWVAGPLLERLADRLPAGVPSSPPATGRPMLRAWLRSAGGVIRPANETISGNWLTICVAAPPKKTVGSLSRTGLFVRRCLPICFLARDCEGPSVSRRAKQANQGSSSMQPDAETGGPSQSKPKWNLKTAS